MLEQMLPAGNPIVQLKYDGIRKFRDCNEEQGLQAKPATDDKVFRLEKIAIDACKALYQQDV